MDSANARNVEMTAAYNMNRTSPRKNPRIWSTLLNSGNRSLSFLIFFRNSQSVRRIDMKRKIATKMTTSIKPLLRAIVSIVPSPVNHPLNVSASPNQLSSKLATGLARKIETSIEINMVTNDNSPRKKPTRTPTMQNIIISVMAMISTSIYNLYQLFSTLSNYKTLDTEK